MKSPAAAFLNITFSDQVITHFPHDLIHTVADIGLFLLIQHRRAKIPIFFLQQGKFPLIPRNFFGFQPHQHAKCLVSLSEFITFSTVLCSFFFRSCHKRGTCQHNEILNLIFRINLFQHLQRLTRIIFYIVGQYVVKKNCLQSAFPFQALAFCRSLFCLCQKIKRIKSGHIPFYTLLHIFPTGSLFVFRRTYRFMKPSEIFFHIPFHLL